MPFLICQHLDKRTEWKVVVNEDSFTLGCSEGATVPIPDSSLEAKEIFVSKAGERYFFRDLAEKNRVFLNGTLTREGHLTDGDRLRLGRITLLFYDEPPRGGGEVDLFREAAPDEHGVSREPRLEAEEGGEALDPRESFAGGFQKVKGPLLLLGSLALGALLGALGSRKETSLTSDPTPAAQADPAASKALAAPIEGDGGKKAPPTPSPAPFPAPPTDPVASRGALFRQFLDVTGRPPTRGEERDLLGAETDVRKQRILEIAGRENGGPRPPLPPASAASQASGGGVGSRRERSPDQRARSFLVDCLDRAPPSPADVAVVAEALKVQGAALDVARTLVYSMECRLPPSEARGARDGSQWWEEEFFRFLLRLPTASEREEISLTLERAPREERRRWLVIALASLPEYGSY
jgi:hypothetical protein